MAVNIDGNGLIALGGTSSTQGRLRLAEDTDNGTNYIELTAPASVGSDRVITFPDATTTVVGTDTTQTLTNKSIVATQLTGTIAAARLPAGSVLQVVSTTKTDTFSHTGTTWTDVTGLSVSITPTNASSKILILSNVNISSSIRYSAFRFVRDSTAISVGSADGNRVPVTASSQSNQSASNDQYIQHNSGASFLDSPNTTSATTYKIQIASTHDVTSVTYINRPPTSDDATYTNLGVSTITVMEIAG